MTEQFVFPDWVPTLVKSQAIRKYQIFTEIEEARIADLALRLAAISQMEKVWKLLLSKERDSTNFRFPAYQEPETFPDPFLLNRRFKSEVQQGSIDGMAE
jgi:hypothetical protein